MQKVVRIPRKFVGLLLSVIIVGLGVVGSAGAASAATTPASCVNVSVVVLGQKVRVCVPTAQLPKVTTTITAKASTVTKTLMGRTTTVKSTAVRNVPGPVTTRTVTKTRTIPGPVSTRGPIRQTVTSRATVTQTTTVTQTPPTVTATRTDVRTVDRDRVVNLTTPQATGISLGLVAVGALLALLVLYIMYRLGYMRAETQNVKDLEDLRDSLVD